MTMGKQDLVQAAKTNPTAEELALGALAAVHQKTVLFMHDHGCRQPPADRGR